MYTTDTHKHKISETSNYWGATTFQRKGAEFRHLTLYLYRVTFLSLVAHYFKK